MSVPSQLQNLIQEANKSLYRHPQHDLNLGYRHAIWAAFGENGHLRRTALALSTVRHVLPIWNQQFSNDDKPQQVLTLAEKVISGDVSKALAEKESKQLWREIQQLGYDDSGIAFSVGCAAVASLDTAIFDENFDADEIDFNLTDEQDTEGNDTAFFAACAYANGPVWETISGKSDSAKRLEFWSWWLNIAVPNAWEAIEEDENLDIPLLEAS
ncbi:MAG: Imm5 family immunity protein [Scytonema sp. PMC 1069.18]|nr:Imm5 family immunity protein [Scytonema sp. PMC 1069.18]MEC4886083.1 Imm5 family immunity protein [Scytonema sp. PMC 1070.18]